MSDFVEWLDGQIESRGWRPADLSKRSGINSGLLSNILNRKRNAGPETCMAIARAFDLPPEEVFRQAGLLPKKSNDQSSLVTELSHLMDMLSDEEQEYILTTARALLDRKKKSH